MRCQCSVMGMATVLYNLGKLLSHSVSSLHFSQWIHCWESYSIFAGYMYLLRRISMSDAQLPAMKGMLQSKSDRLECGHWMEQASDSFFGSEWLQNNTVFAVTSDAQKIFIWVRNLCSSPIEWHVLLPNVVVSSEICVHRGILLCRGSSPVFCVVIS